MLCGRDLAVARTDPGCRDFLRSASGRRRAFLPVLTGFFDGRQREGQGHLRPRGCAGQTPRRIAGVLSALVSRLHRRTGAIRGPQSPHVRATATTRSARHLRTSLSFH
ncbi:hypothetical protein PAHAL_4G009900 [Panicum hallii]|uniref:Uncharacterized protein n=1 Tax=Panicum hallii TaxID=206008 RepID=A0A2T8JBD6_9POAL|nr:hypothetical protein PAHAL_4G009900 [Panicum hallii]